MALQTKQFAALFNEGYSFPDLLPYIEYTDDVFVLADGSFGKIWELHVPGVEGRKADEIHALSGQWEGVLNRMPEGLACQFILTSDSHIEEFLSPYLNLTEVHGEQAFAQGKIEHARYAVNKGFFRHRGEQFTPKRIRLFLTVRTLPVKEAHNKSIFKAQINLIEGLFLACGAAAKTLDGAQLAAWLYSYLNPHRNDIIPNSVFNEREPIRNQILFNSPTAAPTGFVLDGIHSQIVTLKELPQQTLAGMFTLEQYAAAKFCLIDLPQELMFVMNFTVVGTSEAMGRLNMQKSFTFMHKENWLGDQSIEAVEKKKELDETISHLYKGGGKIIHARYHWVIRDSNREALDAACNSLLSGLSRFNCSGNKEEIIGASLGLTCLPLNFDPQFERYIRRARRLSSGNAADMLPVMGSFNGTKTPAQIYYNRRGEIVPLDFFDSNSNPHGVIIGASGAGKSFFVNDFIQQNERLGAHFFVLDKGDSYKKINEILNGTYVSFDLNNPVTINPFANPPTPENLSYILSLLSQMASGGDERDRLSREEEGLLQQAVVKTYEGKSPRAEVTLSDVTACLNDNAFNDTFGINSVMGPTLALRLTPFTRKGPYGRFFDGPNNFNLSGRFTVFELANLSAYPDLQVIVLLNIMFFMTNFVSAEHMRTKRKYFFVDEAWSLLKVKNTADFITNAFKTFRKYRCSVVAITQEIADLTRQESGAAIVANAANKIFLKQEAAVIDSLKEKLSLDEGIIKALKTVETVKGKFSEAFVITDSGTGVIRLVPDPVLYWAANSEPKNNAFLQAKSEQCGSLIEAVKLCAKEYPYGL